MVSLDTIVQAKGVYDTIIPIIVLILGGIGLVIGGLVRLWRKPKPPVVLPNEPPPSPKAESSSKNTSALIGLGVLLIVIGAGLAIFMGRSPTARRVAGVF
jgi:hypothetical protein